MRYQADDLTIESLPGQDSLVIRWLGRSDGADPSRALQPLLDAVAADLQSAQSVEFDFRSLEYMNSSTIRPILKLIQRASSSATSVRLIYDKSKNWQRLSFTAIGAALTSFGNVELSA